MYTCTAVLQQNSCCVKGCDWLKARAQAFCEVYICPLLLSFPKGVLNSNANRRKASVKSLLSRRKKAKSSSCCCTKGAYNPKDQPVGWVPIEVQYLIGAHNLTKPVSKPRTAVHTVIVGRSKI
jgi:hypothetical protein